MIDVNRCFGCMEDRGAEIHCPFCGYHPENNDDNPLQLAPGTILHDTYLVGRALGQGGFGITYLGWDLNLNVKLAIKEFFPQQYATRLNGENRVSAFSGSLGDQYAYGLDKFLQEARILARFEGHPNIVAVRNYFQANGTAYLVMSYVEGVTLKEYMENAGGTVPYDQALTLIKPVLEALKEVHAAGILHRDISPDNIFINKKGQVVLLDFGAARQAIGEREKSISIILKPGFAPEEQYRRRGMQGPWTDIYAVAATMYFLITAIQPPEALERLAEDTLVPPGEMGVMLPGSLEQALLKGLAVRAPERFQDVAAFQKALLDDHTPAAGFVPASGHQQEYAGLPNRQNSQMEPPVGQKQANPSPQTSVISTGFHEHLTSPLSHPAAPVKRSNKMPPLARGGAALVALAVIVFFAVKIISGLTEPANLQPDARDGEADSIFALNGEMALEEGTIPLDGGIYQGQLLNGVPHGYGVWTDSDGAVYEGEFADGMANGQGVIIWPDGEQYDGQWKNDEMNGYGVWTGPDGSIYEGDFANDLFNGMGVITWPDGERYEGYWADDLMHGEGIYTWPEGDRYEGEFRFDKMHGWGRYTYADGEVLEGRWEDDEYLGN